MLVLFPDFSTRKDFQPYKQPLPGETRYLNIMLYTDNLVLAEMV